LTDTSNSDKQRLRRHLANEKRLEVVGQGARHEALVGRSPDFLY
jgi:hypothetical protein